MCPLWYFGQLAPEICLHNCTLKRIFYVSKHVTSFLFEFWSGQKNESDTLRELSLDVVLDTWILANAQLYKLHTNSNNYNKNHPRQICLFSNIREKCWLYHIATGERKAAYLDLVQALSNGASSITIARSVSAPSSNDHWAVKPYLSCLATSQIFNCDASHSGSQSLLHSKFLHWHRNTHMCMNSAKPAEEPMGWSVYRLGTLSPSFKSSFHKVHWETSLSLVACLTSKAAPRTKRSELGRPLAQPTALVYSPLKITVPDPLIKGNTVWQILPFLQAAQAGTHGIVILFYLALSDSLGYGAATGQTSQWAE